MSKIPEEVCDFFNSQDFVIVSTIDSDGAIHNACKGIIKIEKNGKIYLLDLYFKKTFENLAINKNISVTAVNEHGFTGFCLKGKGKIVRIEELGSDILKAWEEKITSRITKRLIRNIKGEQGHPRHPEANLPKPQYMIVVETEKVIDLTPAHIKQDS